MSRFALQQLESRCLLSASGAAILAADQTELSVAQNQANTDAKAGATLANTDAAAVYAARQATVKGSAQQVQFAKDKNASIALLAADKAAIQTAATNGLPTVTDDYKTIAADQGNATALAGAQAQLATDQATYQSAVAAAVAKLQTDQASTATTLAADRAAINTLLQSTPAYTSAVAKQQSDAAATAATNRTDQAIVNGMQKLLQTDQQTYGGSSGDGTLSLLGVSSGLPGSDADTVADQAEISSIQAQLKTDQQTQTSDKTSDTAALAAARRATLLGSSQVATLASNEAKFTTLLAADDKAIRLAFNANIQPVITAFEQIAADQGNPSALNLDQHYLVIDQTGLHNAVASAVGKLETDKADSTNILNNDHTAIDILLVSTPAYTSAEMKLNQDVSVDSAKVQTDQAILSAAQAKLAADQAAAPPWNITVVTGGTVSGSFLLVTGSTLTGVSPILLFASSGLNSNSIFLNQIQR
jgi:hypothetical protein